MNRRHFALLFVAASALSFVQPSFGITTTRNLWLPVESGLCSFHLNYGKLRLSNRSSRSPQRHRIERANAETESWIAHEGQYEYEWTHPDGRRDYLFVKDDSIAIERTSVTDTGKTILKLNQPVTGWLSVSLEGEEKYTLKAPSLWHVYLRSPELFEKHLTPLLHDMRVNVDVPATGKVLLSSAIEHAQKHPSLSFLEKGELIVSLSSDDYLVRRYADQELAKLGPAIVPTLRSPPFSLDREQERRFKQLLSGIEAGADDRPERLAMYLSEDPWFWAEVFKTGDQSQKLIAAQRIKHLTTIDVELEEKMVETLQVERTLNK